MFCQKDLSFSQHAENTAPYETYWHWEHHRWQSNIWYVGSLPTWGMTGPEQTIRRCQEAFPKEGIVFITWHWFGTPGSLIRGDGAVTTELNWGGDGKRGSQLPFWLLVHFAGSSAYWLNFSLAAGCPGSFNLEAGSRQRHGVQAGGKKPSNPQEAEWFYSMILGNSSKTFTDRASLLHCTYICSYQIWNSSRQAWCGYVFCNTVAKTMNCLLLSW